MNTIYKIFKIISHTFFKLFNQLSVFTRNVFNAAFQLFILIRHCLGHFRHFFPKFGIIIISVVQLCCCCCFAALALIAGATSWAAATSSMIFFHEYFPWGAFRDAYSQKFLLVHFLGLILITIAFIRNINNTRSTSSRCLGSRCAACSSLLV